MHGSNSEGRGERERGRSGLVERVEESGSVGEGEC